VPAGQIGRRRYDAARVIDGPRRVDADCDEACLAGVGERLSQRRDHVGDDGVRAFDAPCWAQALRQQLAALGDDDGQYLRCAEVDAADDEGSLAGHANTLTWNQGVGQDRCLKR